ncbi:Putative mitogen-activated protein kinase kinase kinase 7-like [Geodia barretti]|uniref:Mitogen-activated protein kinase kinase kinase 7-like n=1 Tax=Geodia barretti TaxID=519541 RepID=A0AA35TK90_GEOBA|nr:Putative mitogen-activated protein kinase kinase kinase 7-like [Geodia barretti]
MSSSKTDPVLSPLSLPFPPRPPASARPAIVSRGQSAGGKMSGGKGATNTVHVKYRKIHTSDLKYDDKFLERGTYGDVKKATWQDKNVAVKMFPYAERKGGFSEELVCLTMLHEHAYIVNLHGAHLGNSQTDRPFLVLEFAPYSLEKVLHKFREELEYTVDNVMSWTVQMVIALEFIHSKDMLHRDIKPSKSVKQYSHLPRPNTLIWQYVRAKCY